MKIPRRQMSAWREAMERAQNPKPLSETPWGGGLPEKQPRAPRANNEARDMERLVVMAAREWWWPGFRHHMQERASRREAWDGFSRGVKPGWPDVTLLIPPTRSTRGWPQVEEGVRAALELKAEERRPKTQPKFEWWLSGLFSEGRESAFGLTLAQARCLQDLHAVGFQTMVAYGAQEAFDWLNEVAGPKPDVLPEGWE